VSTSVGIAKYHWSTGRLAHILVDEVFEHFFDFFPRNAMLGTMLYVSARVVVEIPNN